MNVYIPPPKFTCRNARVIILGSIHICVEYASKNWIAVSQDMHMLSFSRYQIILPLTVYENFNCSSCILASTPYFLFQFSASSWYWILVLFCITVMSNGVNLSTFSCVWWPIGYLLLWSSCLDILPIFMSYHLSSFYWVIFKFFSYFKPVSIIAFRGIFVFMISTLTMFKYAP